MLASLYRWSINISTCMSDILLLLFSGPFIRMKVQGDGLVDKIYTSTRTFVPAFLLPLLGHIMPHTEHKKNRAPI
jgi:hypothetical protein